MGHTGRRLWSGVAAARGVRKKLTFLEDSFTSSRLISLCQCDDVGKDFLRWHRAKGNIHFRKERPFFHSREVWVCSVGVNIGFEQDGRGGRFLRPVVIIRKFSDKVLWGLPLTTARKSGQYYYRISPVAARESSTVILSQIRLIDSKRLQYKIGDISREEILEIKKRLTSLLW